MPVAECTDALDAGLNGRAAVQAKKGRVMPDSNQPLNHFDYRNSAEADVVCKRNFYFWVC